MADNLLKSIVVLALFFSVVSCLMTMNKFNELVRKRCYNRTTDYRSKDGYLINGQRIPLSSSMETLIGLLESFEANYTMFTPSQVAEKFLRRFRIDGLQRSKAPSQREYSFMQGSLDQLRQEVIETVLFGKSDTRDEEFPEEAFTEEEKCALYFIMSHTFTICSTDDNVPKDEDCWIEKGVVSLYDHEIHAIAPGRVLLGILAGLRNLKEVSISEILGSSYRVEDHKQQYLKNMIDPLYAVTVGDLVVEEMRRVETDDTKRKFGPNGKWNSTICPIRYEMRNTKEPSMATYAELRGAGDGVILGLKAKEMLAKDQRIRVSSLLRMYYSEHGIRFPGTVRRYRYCDRYEHWGEIDKELRQQILFYARFLDIKSPVSNPDEKSLDDQVNEAMTSFEHSRNDIVGVIGDARCREYDSTPCEKQSDIFVVLDTRENTPMVRETQKEIISDLATYLDIHLYGGSMTIMSLSRGYGDRQLEYIVENTTLKGCIGCLLYWVNPQGLPEDEIYVFQSINKTLMNFEKEKQMLPGVPGKVLIYFNYADSPSKSNRQLKDAIWEVHNKHRDVPVFAIGESSELLKMFATDDDYILIDKESMGKTLNEEICRSFSTFQYPNCWDRKSSLEDAPYQGYITEGYTQYWAMYPEYFLKSFKVKFVFTAENGQITVCHSRDRRKDRLQRNCEDTQGTGKERFVEFTMSNPCKGRNVYNCNPFYFTIKGKEVDSSSRLCTDKECKYVDQIKFTVRHEGVSCNSSSFLTSSLTIMIALLVIYYMIRKNI